MASLATGRVRRSQDPWVIPLGSGSRTSMTFMTRVVAVERAPTVRRGEVVRTAHVAGLPLVHVHELGAGRVVEASHAHPARPRRDPSPGYRRRIVRRVVQGRTPRAGAPAARCAPTAGSRRRSGRSDRRGPRGTHRWSAASSVSASCSFVTGAHHGAHGVEVGELGLSTRLTRRGHVTGEQRHPSRPVVDIARLVCQGSSTLRPSAPNSSTLERGSGLRPHRC